MAIAIAIHTTNAFCPAPSRNRGTGYNYALFSSSGSSDVAGLVENLPSVEDLKSAPFMKQVGYGADMTDALTALEKSSVDSQEASLSKTLQTSLSAQLSHSDGIRGFMVSYLTGSYEDSTDEDGGIDAAEMIATEQDPKILLETLSGLLSNNSNDDDDDGNSNSNDDLVSLMCMNVIMPIAMITMHQDPALSAASRLTAARGIRLLGSVVNPSISENLSAIQKAAATNDDNDNDNDDDDDSKSEPLVDYWTNFFAKWGYEEAQRKDIAAATEEMLSKSSSQ